MVGHEHSLPGGGLVGVMMIDGEGWIHGQHVGIPCVGGIVDGNPSAVKFPEVCDSECLLGTVLSLYILPHIMPASIMLITSLTVTQFAFSANTLKVSNASTV